MATTRAVRRHYLVKRGLQLRYVSIIVLSMLLASCLTGTLLYLDIWGAVIPEFSEARLAEKLEIAGHLRDYEVSRGLHEDHPELRLFREAQLLSGHEQAVVANVLRAANLRVLPKVGLLLLVIALAGILLSHRIAGPVHRFITSARALGRGDLTAMFSLRKDDELGDLAAALDDMARSLRKPLAHIRASIGEVTKDLHALSQAESLSAQDRRRIAALSARLAGVRQDLAAFTLERPQ